MSSATIAAIAGQSRAVKEVSNWLFTGSPHSPTSRGRPSSSNRASAVSRSASSNISFRFIRSPSTVCSRTTFHSASKPSCEVPKDLLVTTAPTSLKAWTDFDVAAQLRRDVPRSAEYCRHVARGERCPSPVVDVDPFRCRRRKLLAIDRGAGVHDGRPCLRVGRGLPGKVSRIELREGAVDVVRIEPDRGNDSSVDVDLCDADRLMRNASGRWSLPSSVNEREPSARRGCNDVCVIVVTPRSAIACISASPSSVVHVVSAKSDAGLRQWCHRRHSARPRSSASRERALNSASARTRSVLERRRESPPSSRA